MAGAAQGILGSLRILVDADTAKAQRAIQSLGGRAQIAGAAVGAGMGLIATGAMSMGYAYANAMDDMRVTTGRTGDELAGLEQDFQGLLKRVPYDVGQVSAVMAQLNQRMLLTGEPLQDLTEQILQLGRITRTDASVAVGAITRMFGDWSIASDQQSAALDKLFRASQATGLGYQELAEQVVAYGAPLRNIGFSFEEALTMMGKWEKEGVNTVLALGGLKQALGKFAGAGLDARTATLELFDQIKELGPGAEAMALGVQMFGKRAGPDMVAAIQEGRFELESLLKVVEDGGETITQASKDTEGLQEAWRTFKNFLMTTVGPGIMQELGDIGAEMGNMVFLLPALGGALGKGIVKMAQSGPVKAAAGMAGKIIGKAIGTAMMLGDALVGAIRKSAIWQSVGRTAGSKFGKAFGIAAAAAMALIIIQQLQELGEVRQKNVEQAAANTQAMKDLLAQAPSRAEAEQKLAALKAIPQELEGIQGDIYRFSEFANGNILGSAIDGLFGANPAQNLKEQIQALEEYIAGMPAEVAAAVPSGPGPMAPALAEPIKAAFAVARKEVAKGFGSVKDALQNPPKMISKGDRLENMTARLKAVMRQMRKAVSVGDPYAIAYWEKARAKVTLNMKRLRKTNVADLGDIKSAYKQAGVRVKGTWADIKRTSERESDAAGDAAVTNIEQMDASIDAIDTAATGSGLMARLAAGIRAGIADVRAAALEAAAAAAGPLESKSPPKEGPLSTIDQWGGPLVDSWLGGITKSEPRVRAVGARLAGALAPAPAMGRLALAGAYSGSGRGWGDTFNVGVLVADDGGIDALDRRIAKRRRLRERGHSRYNDPG